MRFLQSNLRGIIAQRCPKSNHGRRYLPQKDIADCAPKSPVRLLGSHASPARAVSRALIDEYRAAGIEELCDARAFRVPPFLEMGQAPGVVQRFGSTDRLQESLREMQRQISAARLRLNISSI